MAEEMKEMNRLESFQRSMTEQWNNKIVAAREAKKDFTLLADQCRAFYSDDCGFMWKQDFRDKYMGNIATPNFQVTINKAFEYVTIYGPYLFWDYPTRYCKPYVPIEFSPEVFGDVKENPELLQQYQKLTTERDQKHAVSELRANLMSRYLDYSQREQRQKLAVEAGYAIVDAMLTGRGLLWPEKYQFPASGRTLTGLFHGSVDDFIIDPDCVDPGLKTATWIGRRHVSTTWELERRFGHDEGSLKKYGSSESTESQVTNTSPQDGVQRTAGQTNNRIVWYEIYSRGGVGTRHADIESTLHDDFEDLFGDYVYLCISPTVPFFLNHSPDQMEDAEDDDEILDKMSWPFPCWFDSRWPVAILDFNTKSKSCWPVPPLGPAMGWLIAINILTSAALENAYENRKQLIGVIGSARKEVEEALTSSGSAIIELKDNLNKSINDVVQYLNKPGMNRDVWDGVEYCSNNFNKATGLVEFMYAEQTTADRSARATAAKEEKSGIRPEKMANDVAAWMTEASELEKILAAFEVEGKDIEGLLGPVGAHLWDQFIFGADPEEVCREMTSTCEASDMRRPNRERDTATMVNMQAIMIPMMQQMAATRGDEEGVAPLNSFIQTMGRLTDIDMTDWVLPPFAPPPDPEMQQLQKQLQEMELEKGGADVAATKAQATKTLVDAQVAGQGEDNSVDNELKQKQFQFDIMKKIVDMKMDKEKHQEGMRQDIASFHFKGAQMQQAMELKEQSGEG